MHFFKPTVILTALLAKYSTAYSPWPGDTSAAWIAIHQTLHTYPLAIDSKNFPLLSQVFTSDAVANYQAPLGILNGTAEIEAVLLAALTPVTTQHALSTQFIDFSSAISANSTTYFTASHFGEGPYTGQVAYAYGKYLDELICEGGEEKRGHSCQWLIKYRVLEYMGPLIGNASIFTYRG